MKTIANRLAAFAVSAVVLGTLSFGQTTVMKAQIPFAFHTSGGLMPAGQYIVTDGYSHIGEAVRLQNADSYKSVITMTTPVNYKGSTATTLTFRCDDGCWLVGMQTQNHSVSFRGIRRARGRELALITIPLASASAE